MWYLIARHVTSYAVTGRNYTNDCQQLKNDVCFKEVKSLRHFRIIERGQMNYVE